MDGKSNNSDEAVLAGENALRCLVTAIDYLDEAKEWAEADAFGGGLVITFKKYSSIDDAKQYIKDAKMYLAKFKKELEGVDGKIPNVSIGKVTTATDILLDGLIADFWAFRRISKLQDNVSDAIFKLKDILEELKQSTCKSQNSDTDDPAEKQS